MMKKKSFMILVAVDINQRTRPDGQKTIKNPNQIEYLVES
jgi:hypothetical protein